MGRASGKGHAISVEAFAAASGPRTRRSAAQVRAERAAESADPVVRLAAELPGAYAQACAAYVPALRDYFFGSEGADEQQLERKLTAVLDLQKALARHVAVKALSDLDTLRFDAHRQLLQLPASPGGHEQRRQRLGDRVAFSLDTIMRCGLPHDPDRELTPELCYDIARREHLSVLASELAAELQRDPEARERLLPALVCKQIDAAVPEHPWGDTAQEVFEQVLEDVCGRWLATSTIDKNSPGVTDREPLTWKPARFSRARFQQLAAEMVAQRMQQDRESYEWDLAEQEDLRMSELADEGDE